MSEDDQARRRAQLACLDEELAAGVGEVPDVGAGPAPVTAAGPVGGDERGRLHVPGRLVDTGADHLMLLVQEPGGAWRVHGDAAGVRVEADVMVTACKAVLTRAGQGGTQWSWYVRSPAARDTHRAQAVHRDGSVMAVCGARFRPLLVRGRKALPGRPPNPERVCPSCRAGRAAPRDRGRPAPLWPAALRRVWRWRR